MKVNTTYKAIGAGVLVSLLCVFGHDYLPEKRLVVYPSENFEAYLFTGTGSQASWIDQDRMHWRCDVPEGLRFTTCGVTFGANGDQRFMDLRSFSSFELKMKLKSPEKRVRLFLKSWLGDFSSKHGGAEQHSYVTIRNKDLAGADSFNLRQLSVPDWWAESYDDLPSEYLYPFLKEVGGIGIDLGSPIHPGVHEVQLEKLAFTGEFISAEILYRGLLLAWLSALVPFALIRYLHMKQRLARERRQLERLALHNNELEDQTATFKQLSMHDNLTGALNRSGLQAELTEIGQILTGNQQLALLVIDLDHFKRINDKRGHDVGDLVLKKVAEVFRQNIRATDRLARWGGEEFLVLCPHLNEPGAFTLAEKLRQAVAGTEFNVEPQLKVTASIGVCCFDVNSSFDEAFKRADNAVYEAKNQGRNCSVMAE